MSTKSNKFVGIFIMMNLLFLPSCTVKIAHTEYVKKVGDGSQKVKPSWEIKETGFSAAMPYVITAAAAGGAYLLTPKPASTTTTTTTEKPTDPRATNAVYAGLGAYVVSFFLKKYIVKEQKTKMFTMSEAEMWTKKWDNRFASVGFDPQTEELYVVDAKQLNKEAIDNLSNPIKYTTFKPTVFIDNQIFPSVVISTANSEEQAYKNLSGSLGLILESKYAGGTIKYEIECTEKNYFDKVVGEYTFKYANRPEKISPTIKWNYATLRKQEQSSTISVTFRILNTKSNDAKTGKIDSNEVVMEPRMRSAGDCLFMYKNESGEIIDFQEHFAAFVNEEHPEIDDILKQALKKAYTDAFYGYQGGTKESVHKQVKAIYKELKDRGIHYSSVTMNVGGGNVADQYVRSFSQSLKSDQANCIDGTCLFASILRKIGIDPLIIMVPGHAFLGYLTNDEKDPVAFLETTRLGYDSFEVALQKGTQKIEQTPEKQIKIINIKKARYKFKPIGN